MSNTPIEPKKKEDIQSPNVPTTEEQNLKGTFTSVMLLGGFIIVTWVSVFLLFLSRS